MAPSEFLNEKALHDHVEEAPSVLPLSDFPRLVIVGREVPLGSGYADLLAVDAEGQPVVIEIKLARNSEARRAVISQVLGYAAELYGMNAPDLEWIASKYLQPKGLNSISAAVEVEDQEESFDDEVFQGNLESNLATGHFRMVVVLDDAPTNLVTIAR